MNAWDEVIKAFSLIETDKQEEPIEYRLHYNEQGQITMCTMRQHPTDTKYLVVTKQEYENYFKYHIVNDELTLIVLDKGTNKPITQQEVEKISVPKHAAILFDKHANTDNKNN